jgi:hypothetical protein
VAVLLTAGVLAASVVVLEVAGTPRLLLRSRWATVLLWAQAALEDVVAVVVSEVALTAVVEASEADVVALAVVAASIAVAVVDVSAIVVTAPLMELLQALAAVGLAAGLAAATEDVGSKTAALAATLTLSLCLLEEVTVAVIAVVTVELIAELIVEVAATGTATATALAVVVVVGMLDKNDLTTAVGMTSRDRDAATKPLFFEHLTGLTVQSQQSWPTTTWPRQKHDAHSILVPPLCGPEHYNTR